MSGLRPQIPQKQKIPRKEELSWGDIAIYFAMMLAVAVILSVYIFGVAFLLETIGINRYAGIAVAILALMVGLYIYGRRMRLPPV